MYFCMVLNYFLIQGKDGVALMMKWKQDIRVKVMITLTNPEADFTIYNYTLTAEKQVFDQQIAEIHVAKMLYKRFLYVP